MFSTDPTCWSQCEVARWLRQKMQELKIPAASCQPALQWAANFEGKGLVQITEQEFKARFPQVIQVTWKTASFRIYTNLSKVETFGNLSTPFKKPDQGI